MTAVAIRTMLRRPRTWISIVLLCAVPSIVAGFLAVNEVAPRPGEGPPFLAAVLADGTLFPAAALAIVLPVFLPLAVAVVAGDSIAGEASAGTLRYLLVRPVGRARLLAAKVVMVVAFVLLAVIAVAVTGYVVGTALFGPGEGTGVASVSGVSLTPAQVLARTVLTVAYVGWSMLGVAAVAMLLSTVSDSSLGAALGALAVLVLSQVLVTLDAAAAVRPYLPTRYWLAWVDFFRDPILWYDVQRGVAVQAVYVVVLLGAAWANFMTKDVVS